MPAYKYFTKDGKTNGTPTSTMMIGLASVSTNAKEVFLPKKRL